MPVCEICKTKFKLKKDLEKHLKECKPKELTFEEKLQEKLRCFKLYENELDMSLSLIKDDYYFFKKKVYKLFDIPHDITINENNLDLNLDAEASELFTPEGKV